MKAPVAISAAVAAASLLWAASRGLPSDLVYYVTPTELASRSTHMGAVRVGGEVEPGSVESSGGRVRFVLTDGVTRLPVIETGEAPPLFRGGIGAVVEGRLDAAGSFRADVVMVKHSERYEPPGAEATPP